MAERKSRRVDLIKVASRLTMLMIDICVCRCVAFRNNTFNLLVAFKLLRQALLVDLDSFKIFSTRRRIIQDLLTQCPRTLDVVVDPLESLEALQVIVRLPRVVNV